MNDAAEEIETDLCTGRIVPQKEYVRRRPEPSSFTSPSTILFSWLGCPAPLQDFRDRNPETREKLPVFRLSEQCLSEPVDEAVEGRKIHRCGRRKEGKM